MELKKRFEIKNGTDLIGEKERPIESTVEPASSIVPPTLLHSDSEFTIEQPCKPQRLLELQQGNSMTGGGGGGVGSLEVRLALGKQ